MKRSKSRPPMVTPPRRPTPPPELNIGPAPQTDDPYALADYLRETIDALEENRSPVAQRLHRALVGAIETYAAEREDDPEGAKLTFKQTFYGIELGALEIFLRNIRKVRDRFARDAKQLGTGSPGYKLCQRTTETMAITCEALGLVIDACRVGDDVMRRKAYDALEQVKGGWKLLEQLAAEQEPAL